jgi:hypothetical protein
MSDPIFRRAVGDVFEATNRWRVMGKKSVWKIRKNRPPPLSVTGGKGRRERDVT